MILLCFQLCNHDDEREKPTHEFFLKTQSLTFPQKFHTLLQLAADGEQKVFIRNRSIMKKKINTELNDGEIFQSANKHRRSTYIRVSTISLAYV